MGTRLIEQKHPKANAALRRHWVPAAKLNCARGVWCQHCRAYIAQPAQLPGILRQPDKGQATEEEEAPNTIKVALSHRNEASNRETTADAKRRGGRRPVGKSSTKMRKTLYQGVARERTVVGSVTVQPTHPSSEFFVNSELPKFHSPQFHTV